MREWELSGAGPVPHSDFRINDVQDSLQNLGGITGLASSPDVS